MEHDVNYRKQVQYETMTGRKAIRSLKEFPVAYLPIGCLERHGDHLPMGLDVIKAYGVCSIVASTVGGVVFPPHHYAGIHQMAEERLEKNTGEWGNLYTNQTARDNLIDIINQIALMHVRVVVLYSGHYPLAQVDLIKDISVHFESHSTLSVIPFCEPMIMAGDHAGVSETSFMLYLDKNLADMTAISEKNYQDHGWRGEKDPKHASAAQGEESVQQVISYLKAEIDNVLNA